MQRDWVRQEITAGVIGAFAELRGSEQIEHQGHRGE
jgi:hypothetical protein